MSTEPRYIRTAADVTEDVTQAVWEVVEGWYLDRPIDWEDVFDRAERWSDLDFGQDWDSPAIRKIKRTVREWKREAVS